jgi:hypothetical protein
VTVKTFAASGIVGVPQDLIKRFDDVLVSNRVLIFGYPSSIGLRHGGPPGQRATMDTIKDLAQLDYARPLLRSGIVAGKNQARRTLVIDCPSYWGNSGGPVLEIEQADALTWNFRVMGVVTANGQGKRGVIGPGGRCRPELRGDGRPSTAMPSGRLGHRLDRRRVRGDVQVMVAAALGEAPAPTAIVPEVDAASMTNIATTEKASTKRHMIG